MAGAVGVLDLITLLAVLAALLCLTRGWQRALERDARWLLAGLLGLWLFRALSNTLEWTGITAGLDQLEDFFEILEPLLWGFFCYAFLNALELAERRQVEAEIARLATVIEQASETIVITNLAGDIVYANPHFEATTGYPVAEALGQNPRLLKSGYQDAAFYQALWSSLAAGQTWRGELVNKRRDGSLYHEEATIFPIKSAEGAITHYAAVKRDVTPRVLAEAERTRLMTRVGEQARQLQQVMSTVPEGVLLLDGRGRIVLANPMAEEHLEALANVRVGDTLTRLADRPLAELLAAPPAGGLWHEVATDGLTFQVIARPVGPNGGPEPESWVLVVKDVTQEREARRRLEQQERLVTVGQLAVGIAHDFNNIMSVIVLYAQMGLLEPNLPAGLRERLQTVQQQARRATDLIQQILDFGRRSVLERRPIDMASFLEAQVGLLRRTLPENIRIDLRYGGDEYQVEADATRLQQVVMNLAVNARDAMPYGGDLCIDLGLVSVAAGGQPPLPEMEPGDWVQVTVTDTGVGIPPEVLPRVFEPFFTTKAPTGTGLGLAQVWGIIQQHAGYVDVASRPGEGTSVVVYLPATPGACSELSPPASEPLATGRGELILVVEDDAAISGALVEGLELLGYRAATAANGREALALLERPGDEIALVLTDLVMPEMGGRELLRALRGRGLTLPVVVLSGHPMDSELEGLLADGLTDWILKPPSVEQLAQTLADALGRADGGG